MSANTKTLKLTLNSVSSFVDDKDGVVSVSYIFKFKEQFPAIVVDYETGEYVESTNNMIRFPEYVAISKLRDACPDIADLHDRYKELSAKGQDCRPFSASTISSALRGATFVVERTKFAEGDEYITYDKQTRTREHSGYDTNFIDVEYTEMNEKRVDRLLFS